MNNQRLSAKVNKMAQDPNSRYYEVENNDYARALFGYQGENLKVLEQDLGISISDKGNTLIMRGTPAALNQAEDALNSLVGKLKRRHIEAVEPADIRGAIKTKSSLVDVAGNALKTRRKLISPRTPTQGEYIEALKNSELVFGVGPAGTGKTYLAVAQAVALFEANVVERMVFTRPAVEAGERLGFLPGDMKEKVDPYLRPIYDALHDMMDPAVVEKYIASGTIEIAPLAFMRGRTLANAAVILDEAQNTTSMQMKMFLTRLGENGRMIINGDPSQIDLPAGTVSGLVEALEVLKGVEGVKICTFTGEDVVRHPLVGRIVKAYEKLSAQTHAHTPKTSAPTARRAPALTPQG